MCFVREKCMALRATKDLHILAELCVIRFGNVKSNTSFVIIEQNLWFCRITSERAVTHSNLDYTCSQPVKKHRIQYGCQDEASIT